MSLTAGCIAVRRRQCKLTIEGNPSTLFALSKADQLTN
jgi:hypothetical protein